MSNKTINEISEVLAQNPDWVVKVESETLLSVTDDAEVSAFLYLGEQQILVESPMFSASEVDDLSALNEHILETHFMLPLSSIKTSIDAGGERWYSAFGALSVNSKPEVIYEEVHTLLSNVPEFLAKYKNFFNTESN